MTTPTAQPLPVTSFLPLTRPSIDDGTIAAVAEVLRSGKITSGLKVKEFEKQLSAYLGGRPVRAFNSGTAALEAALQIAGVRAGDEVITTPLSWVGTSNAIVRAGAKPVFVDIDPVTRNIDLEKAERAITRMTKAILPVDLAGRPVDRERLHELAERYRLRVVEDAAQSLGATWRGKRIGSFGDFTAFSFHAHKNITTIEGGCLVMRDEAEAKLAEQYRSAGVIASGFDEMAVDVVGAESELSEIGACVGLGQLPHIEEFTTQRRERVRDYCEMLDGPAVRGLGLGMPPRDLDESNWNLFQVVLPEERRAIGRAEVMAKMQALGIATGAHFPAIHLFAVYRDLGWNDGDCPIAEKVARTILTLPLFPAMTREDVRRVVEALAGILKGNLKR